MTNFCFIALYSHKYLTDYNVKLIERRIQSGQMTMKQIVDEFGFMEENHFTNYFKKQMKMSTIVFLGYFFIAASCKNDKTY